MIFRSVPSPSTDSTFPSPKTGCRTLRGLPAPDGASRSYRINLVYERARRAAAEFGDKVVFREIDTSERSSVAEWGASDSVLVDGKTVQKGPPPSYEKIRSLIEKRVKRL